MEWPQWVMVGLLTLSFGLLSHVTGKDGDVASVFGLFVVYAGFAYLLWWGGFWTGGVA